MLTLIHANGGGWGSMGVAFVRALPNILDDTPRDAGLPRAQRREAEIDFEEGGEGNETAMLTLIYANGVGWGRIGVALDRALPNILDGTPRHAGLPRFQRREVEIDFEEGGEGNDTYVVLAEDYYEVADTFPTGDNIDALYDWIGLWTYKDLASAVGSKKVSGNFVPVLGTNIHDFTGCG